MTENNKPRLQQLWHLGIVVKNLEKAIEYYSAVFGIGPFVMAHDMVTKKQLVKGKPFTGKLVKGASIQIGSFMIELLEPVDDGPHKWFLDSKGEGIHHLGFMVDDCHAWLDYAKQQGIEILIDSELELPGVGRAHAVYFESDKPGSVIIELTQITPLKQSK